MQNEYPAIAHTAGIIVREPQFDASGSLITRTAAPYSPQNDGSMAAAYDTQKSGEMIG